MRKAIFFVDQAYVTECHLQDFNAIAVGQNLQLKDGRNICVQDIQVSNTDPENPNDLESVPLEIYCLTVDN